MIIYPRTFVGVRDRPGGAMNSRRRWQILICPHRATEPYQVRIARPRRVVLTFRKTGGPACASTLMSARGLGCVKTPERATRVDESRRVAHRASQEPVALPAGILIPHAGLEPGLILGLERRLWSGHSAERRCRCGSTAPTSPGISSRRAPMR